MDYSEISQKNRNALIAQLQRKAPVNYSEADGFIRDYFDHHLTEIPLIGSHDCSLALLVNAVIRWQNKRAEADATTGSRIQATSLQRF